MLLFYDLNLNQWVSAPGTTNPPLAKSLVRGDTPTVGVQFCRGAQIVTLDASTFKFGIKKIGVFAGSYLSYTTTATISGIVSQIAITNPGSGYTVAPAVTISGGGGSGATALAVLSGETIIGVNITNPGQGFTFIPTITIGAPGSGVTATAVAFTSPTYFFSPNLNTTEINNELASDADHVDCNLEIEITTGGIIQSTVRLSVTIYDDVNHGGEGTPTNAVPPYPADPTVFELIANKGAASGYAPLNGSAQISRTFLDLELSKFDIQGTDIASAPTTNIGSATGDFINITGTTTITAFDVAAAGIERKVNFTGSLTLTHNATSLILQRAKNVTTTAGDSAVFVSLGGGNWKCLSYQRTSGGSMVMIADVQPGFVTSYTFANIPQEFRHLFLTGEVATYTSPNWITARINALSSGFTSIWAYSLSGGTVGSQAGPTDGFLLTQGNSAFEAKIMRYSESGSPVGLGHYCTSASAGSACGSAASNSGSSTDAITSLTLYMGGDYFHAAISRFTLYGIP